MKFKSKVGKLVSNGKVTIKFVQEIMEVENSEIIELLKSARGVEVVKDEGNSVKSKKTTKVTKVSKKAKQKDSEKELTREELLAKVKDLGLDVPDEVTVQELKAMLG